MGLQWHQLTVGPIPQPPALHSPWFSVLPGNGHAQATKQDVNGLCLSNPFYEEPLRGPKQQ